MLQFQLALTGINNSFESVLHQVSWWWWAVAFSLAVLTSAAAGALTARAYLRRRLPEQAFLPVLRESSAPASPFESLVPESKFVSVDGIEIHYLQLVPKTTQAVQDVVLLHGIGASTFVWRYLFATFQARHSGCRITAFDLPGFGKSSKSRKLDLGLDAQANSIAAACHALGLQNPILVGSSMGGTIALWMAKKFPDRFGKLVALSPATEAANIPRQIRHMRFGSSYLRRALNRKTMRFILGHVVTRTAMISDEVVDSYLQPFLDNGDAVHAFFAATSVIADRRIPRELAGLESQILVIYGDRDRMVSRRSLEFLVSLLPNALLIRHPDGGHHIMEDEPDWLFDQLNQFMLKSGPENID
jgi:pimeloyl-ACP methyl ester carboxylesterase